MVFNDSIYRHNHRVILVVLFSIRLRRLVAYKTTIKPTLIRSTNESSKKNRKEKNTNKKVKIETDNVVVFI